jgi:hypothetical protein
VASKDPNMIFLKKSTATKREHITVPIPQKLEIIIKLSSDESQRGYDFIQH